MEKWKLKAYRWYIVRDFQRQTRLRGTVIQNFQQHPYPYLKGDAKDEHMNHSACTFRLYS